MKQENKPQHKAWETMRNAPPKRQAELKKIRSKAAEDAWITRRANNSPQHRAWETMRNAPPKRQAELKKIRSDAAIKAWITRCANLGQAAK